MYKLTSHVAKPHLIVVHKRLSNGSCAALVVVRTPVRPFASKSPKQDCDPCAEQQRICPPVPQPKKSNKLLWALFGAGMLTAAGVVYAKNSPNVRNFLESNVPWANSFVALVYQENTTYTKFFTDQVTTVTSKVRDFAFGKEGVAPMEFKQRSEQNLEEDAKIGFAPKTYTLPPPTLEPLYVEEVKPGPAAVEHEATLVQTEQCEPTKPLKVEITKEVLDLEHCMHTNTKAAIEAYKETLKMCKEFNAALDRVLELPLTDLSPKDMTILMSSRKRREEFLASGKEASTKAKCCIAQLERMMENKSILAPPENLSQTKRILQQFKKDLNEQEELIRKECEKYNIRDRHWKLVEEARNKYRWELEALYPGIDLSARQLDLKGEPDLLLMYTMRQVQFLQNELAELQTIQDYKINKAIECHDEKELIKLKAEDMIRREKLEQEACFQRKLLIATKEADMKMKEDLQKLHEMQDSIMKSQIAKKEKEIMSRLNREVSEKMEKERLEYKKQLAAMAGKLKAIEATLKQRAATEQESRRSQALWAAGEALLAATRRAAPAAHVAPELCALEKAGSGDKLVTSVLKGIPSETKEKGIVTEKTLKERFDTVEKSALKVALIGKEGASLPMYFLSWLQSKLLFQKLAEIPRDELDNKPTDFSKLDTFDIMQRARHHMNNNDVGAALRYVNLLQGAPRAAAAPWAHDARRFLEVRQAAEAVMAHASLAGMGSK